MRISERLEGPLIIRGVAGAGVLRLRQGTITVIVGPNGAGKTRLLETAAGLVFQGDAEVVYGRERMWTRAKAGVRKKQRSIAALLAYGYASQSPEEQLFCRTVEEELHYVQKPFGLDRAERERRIDDALSAVGWDRAWLARDPYRMSGGERRRTALACLFATPAPWLLLDEPTAGLDAAGCALLGASLQRSAEAGRGVLLVSHETDWALALADTVLLMGPGGTVRPCGRNALLDHPEWFEQSGMSIPEWLIVASVFRRTGVPEGSVWKPAELAAAVKTPLGQGAAFRRQAGLAAAAPVTGLPEAAVVCSAGPAASEAGPVRPEAAAGRSNEPAGASSPIPGAAGPEPPREADRPAAAPAKRADSASPLAIYDPRSVWLAYLLVSAAILAQRTWLGVVCSALLTVSVVAAFRIPLRRWRGAIAALGAITVIASLLAGFHIGKNGVIMIEAKPFMISLRMLLRPWLAMLLGLGLPLVITPLRLRRSLERLLAVNGRVPVWGQRVILAVTLLLRFIPVLLAEWERFARIALARGKDTSRSWRGAPGRLRDIAIPFMLALFRLGEDAAVALESKGVGRRPYPVIAKTRLWRRRDSLLLAGSIAAAVFLWWLAER